MINVGAIPQDEIAEILGEKVLNMAEQLEYAPDCTAQWEFELDGIEYVVALKRKVKE